MPKLGCTLFRELNLFFLKIYLLFIYLFYFYFWLHRVLVVANEIFIVARRLQGAWALQLWLGGSRACGLCSLRRLSSLVEVPGLSYPAACGIPVP